VRVCLPALALLAIASIASPASGDDADNLVGLAVVPGSDDGVVWSARNIQSFDGSRVFLPGAANVAAVTTAADGTIFAIRGRNRFGVATPDGASIWRATPVAGRTKGLVIVADHIAWFVQTKAEGDVKLALTADQGRHWTVQSLPPDPDEGHLELRAGGVVELDGYIYDCHGGDYSARYRGRIGSNSWRRTRTAAETAYHHPSHYKPLERDGPLNGADGTVRSGSIRFSVESAYEGANGHPARLVGLRDGEIEDRVIANHVPDGFSLITTDARGRLLGVTKNDVWRWSQATGWQALRARRRP